MASVFDKPSVWRRLVPWLHGFDGPLAFAVFMLAFATAYQCVNVWCFGPLDDAEAAPGVTPSSDGIDSSISSWRIGCDPGQSAISIFQDGLDILPIGGGGILQKSIE